MHNLAGHVPATKGSWSTELQWPLRRPLRPGISMTTTPWGLLTYELRQRHIISTITTSRRRQIEGWFSTEKCRRKSRLTSRATCLSWMQILAKLRWENILVDCNDGPVLLTWFVSDTLDTKPRQRVSMWNCHPKSKSFDCARRGDLSRTVPLARSDLLVGNCQIEIYLRRFSGINECGCDCW